MTDQFKDKVLWVTGASGALGGAVVDHLARAGATVVASSRSIPRAVSRFPDSVLHIPADVTNNDSVLAAFEQIRERFGRLDGLVLSTNVAAFGDFLDLDDDAWSRVIEAKLLGSVRPIRAALPLLLEQRSGSIVVISGRGGIAPPPNHFPGSSVNAALDLLVQGLGRKYGPQSVRVNAVAPGPIKSPRFDEIAQGQGDAEHTRLTALRGPGLPSDVADAVAFLLSDASRFVNGTRLYVDGGGPPYA